MPSVTGPVDPFDYIVFGATGDLTMRKLLPALYYRFRDGQMPADARIIGAARSKLSDDDFRGRAEKALARFVKAPDLDEAVARRFIARSISPASTAPRPTAPGRTAAAVRRRGRVAHPGVLPGHFAEPVWRHLPQPL